MSYSGMEASAVTSMDEAGDPGTSVVDRNSEVEGTYATTRDLRVEGRLTGSINCQGVLFVADGAEVDAEVDAASIIVSGRLQGNIRCAGRLEITATGSVGGEVATAALVIVEGARYEGQISMTAGTGESATPDSSIEPEPEQQSDAYSLLRRYASTPAESRDESPASSTDSDEDETR